MNIKRALISVSDKTNLVEFAKALSERGVEIISTGGTTKTLLNAGILVKQVSEVTDFPEILGGRVKTLHPKIFGGILADLSDKTHVKHLKDNEIEPIDLVVVNLYPFDEVQKKTRDEDVLIENIDIGGVALLRAAAKNHRNVVVVCDPSDYDKVIKSIDSCGDVQLHDRRMFALKAFYHTMKYDATIHRVLSELFASEKFEHMTFEKFMNPQFDYEVLDKVGERFIKLSKYTDTSIAIITGAILNFINKNLLVGFTGNLPSSVVDLEKSGKRICNITGEVVTLRFLTNDMVRKLKESTFSTVAYEKVEDIEFAKETLKDKELIQYEYLNIPTKLSTSNMVENIMLKKYLESSSEISLILKILPKYAVVISTDDGYYLIQIDLNNPVEALERLIQKISTKPVMVATNGTIDSLFKKICQENGINVLYSL
ncbi:MAG: IMP cyclohydrolase [Fervidobacterium sp.]